MKTFEQFRSSLREAEIPQRNNFDTIEVDNRLRRFNDFSKFTDVRTSQDGKVTSLEKIQNGLKNNQMYNVIIDYFGVPEGKNEKFVDDNEEELLAFYGVDDKLDIDWFPLFGDILDCCECEDGKFAIVFADKKGAPTESQTSFVTDGLNVLYWNSVDNAFKTHIDGYNSDEEYLEWLEVPEDVAQKWLSFGQAFSQSLK